MYAKYGLTRIDRRLRERVKMGASSPKDARKCGRANQKTIRQNAKRMLNKLFKRTALLVAGIALLSLGLVARAGYTEIWSIYRTDPYHVTVEMNASWTHTFWFTNGTHNPSLNGQWYHVNIYPGCTNVCVYVYDGYPDDEYSWASIDDYWGTNIYNGP